MQSGEFFGQDLKEAIQKTAKSNGSLADRRHHSECRKLQLELSDLKRELGRSSDRITHLKSRIENIKNNRAGQWAGVAVGALTTAGGALGSAAKALSKIHRLNKLNRADIIALIPIVGGLTVAARNLSGIVRGHSEIGDIKRQIETEERRAQGVLQKLNRTLAQMDQLQC